ncbi:hypothetical protein CV770_40060 [Bradyrhizobium sp. AC87j1]|nr:hypothetical protein CV770_40060 [Bradyrhizobium sp. AC87j1]
MPKLPEVLPDSLQHLEVSDNQLTSLPEDFPAMLHTLAVSGNQLSSLPENLLTQYARVPSLICLEIRCRSRC